MEFGIKKRVMFAIKIEKKRNNWRNHHHHHDVA